MGPGVYLGAASSEGARPVARPVLVALHGPSEENRWMAQTTPRARAIPRFFNVVVSPLQAFFRLEAASGIVLLACAVAALVWANVARESYHAILSYPLRIGGGDTTLQFSLHALVNDGLMAIFFFVVGMEIKHELVMGELRTLGQALLPLVAAVGGMLLPALLYVAFNTGGPGLAGWGIPVATDIAFCIGVLTLLRSRVPHALVVFLTALAIFDDIGGILVIALFYGGGIHAEWLLAAGGMVVVLVAMSRAHVRSPVAWMAAGAALWYAFHHAGIHPTLAGVVVGLAVPARPRHVPGDVLASLGAHVEQLSRDRRRRDEGLDQDALGFIDERLTELAAPLDRMVEALHPWVAFVVMPVFALANAGVTLGGGEMARFLGPVSYGVTAGLVLGKAIGIFGFAYLATRFGLARIPGGAGKLKLFGVATVGGIGFTVSLFIASLAFPTDQLLLDEAKLGVLVGSLIAGIAGAALLLASNKVRPAA
jgi:NhaA family Na+:H+ antiporter